MCKMYGWTIDMPVYYIRKLRHLLRDIMLESMDKKIKLGCFMFKSVDGITVTQQANTFFPASNED